MSVSIFIYMTLNRTPNHKCDNINCNNILYKRPVEKKKYCCRKCYFNTITKRVVINCKFCSKSFLPERFTQKFCSNVCAASNLRGPYSKDKFRSKTQYRLKLLKDKFNFNHCMVNGCTYNKVYNVHRFIEGKDGGKYEVGNMFAICPNHHGEYHARLIKFEKISDCELKII